MATGTYREWITPEGVERVRKWAAAGYTDKEIAQLIGVARKTIYDWARKYPDFDRALKSGQNTANAEVEAALYKKCLGYNMELKKTFKLRKVEYDEATGRKISEREELVEGIDEVHVPADTNAQKFWLSNREPERWASREPEGTASESAEAFIRSLGAGE